MRQPETDNAIYFTMFQLLAAQSKFFLKNLA
jgi:hypothetical protein